MSSSLNAFKIDVFPLLSRPRINSLASLLLLSRKLLIKDKIPIILSNYWVSCYEYNLLNKVDFLFSGVQVFEK